MEIYLVGGAVRDEMLGIELCERDWVVVGSTPEAMIAQGYQPVGKDFPVFLHPETHEEYALARTERKTGKGYKGFTFYCAPDITLEEDLKRRDLTVNAMAKAPDGTIIDPFGGKEDVEARLLRHVSPAFEEDPVRILRVARFAARFPDFQVHPATAALMQAMVHSGEVEALVSERVWRELSIALSEPAPARFFEVMTTCGAASSVFAELDRAQMDLEALNRAVPISEGGDVRFAALLHRQNPAAIQALCRRLRIPKATTQLAVITAKHIDTLSQALDATAEATVKLLDAMDAFRRPARFQASLLAAQASLSDTDTAIAIKQYLTAAHERAAGVSTEELLAQGYSGIELGKALHRRRVEVLVSPDISS